MVGVILGDLVLTYLGQPASYWSDPETVHEGNQWFHWVMSRGPLFAWAIDLLYLAGCFLLVSLLPKRGALILLLALVLGHFFGGASWLCFRFGGGAQGMILYGILVSTLLVLLGFPGEGKGGRPVPEGNAPQSPP